MNCIERSEKHFYLTICNEGITLNYIQILQPVYLYLAILWLLRETNSIFVYLIIILSGAQDLKG